MVLNTHTIRFSKEFFNDFETCLKWLDNKNLSTKIQNEFDGWYEFEFMSKDKFVETSLQPHPLDAGVEAIVGIEIEATETLETVQDTGEISVEDVNDDDETDSDESIPVGFSNTTFHTLLLDVVNKLSDLGEPCKKLKSELEKAVEKVVTLPSNITTISVAKNDDVDSDSNETVEGKVSFYAPIIKTKDQRIVFGEVLVPNEVDGQKEIYDEKAVADACHYWMKFYQQMGEMHTTLLSGDDVNVLECYIAPVDFDIETSDGETRAIKAGTWLLKVYVVDDDLWDKIKNGELNGFSIGGVATVTFLTQGG